MKTTTTTAAAKPTHINIVRLPLNINSMSVFLWFFREEKFTRRRNTYRICKFSFAWKVLVAASEPFSVKFSHTQVCIVRTILPSIRWFIWVKLINLSETEILRVSIVEVAQKFFAFLPSFFCCFRMHSNSKCMRPYDGILDSIHFDYSNFVAYFVWVFECFSGDWMMWKSLCSQRKFFFNQATSLR